MPRESEENGGGVRAATWVTGAVTVVATIAGIVAGISGLSGLSLDSPEPPANRPSQQSAATTARLNEMSDRLRSVAAQVKALHRAPNRGRVAAELAAVGKRVETMRRDVADLKSAILPDPVKAVQVTLLSRDLERVSTQTDASIENVRDDFSQLYDLTKLIAVTLGLGVLGLMVTVALAFVASRKMPAGPTAAG